LLPWLAAALLLLRLLGMAWGEGPGSWLSHHGLHALTILIVATLQRALLNAVAITVLLLIWSVSVAGR
jgi:hypothetical protein